MNYLKLLQNGAIAYVLVAGVGVQWYIQPSGAWGYFLCSIGVMVAPPLALLAALFIFSVTMMYLAEKEHPEKDMPEKLANMIVFKDAELQAKYACKTMPMQVFYEAFINSQVDVHGDMYEMLKHQRFNMFRFSFTWYHIKYFCFKLIPQALWHSKSMDGEEVTTVYNRGNDFYTWFLGPSMVYTSGLYNSPTDTLENAQARKMDSICEKLQLQEGESLLDIGCGWGGLVRHACKGFKVKALGVTICKEQVAWAQAGIEEDRLQSTCQVKLLDYRDVPNEKYDKISCVEMAEHVGVLRFQDFLQLVKERLKDEGLFYLQIAGLRAPWQFEDFVWGIFMGTYIFPAADASCPLGFVVNQLEAAGFELHHVQNVGIHYSITIKRWYDNWISNEAAVVAKYGQWWFRLWVIFLSWSSIIASQGSSTCWQIVCHKNINEADRLRYIGKMQYGIPASS